MALRVACPNGCRLQVPQSRAGMMVRCPKCKKIIKLADLSAATKSHDGMALIDAVFPTREELVELKKTVKQAADRSNLVRKSSTGLQVANMQTEQAAQDQKIFQAAVVAPAAQPQPSSKPTEHPRDEVMFIEPASVPVAEEPAKPEQRSPSKPSPQTRWRMPEVEKEKQRLADAARSKPRKPSQLDSAPKSAPQSTSPTVAEAAPNQAVSAEAAPAMEIPASPSAHSAPLTEIIAAAPVESTTRATKQAEVKGNSPAKSAAVETASAARQEGEETSTKTVGVSHNRDARSRAVFLTFALVLVGAFAMIPAISSFVGYVNTSGQTEIPRWAAWLVFLGVLHLFYAVYVAQLADWTSFRIVSIMMLILTALMATLLAGMALGGQGGLISRVFQIPLSLTTKAEIWLLTMLSITSLIGYLSGREAFRWKQIENQLRAAISPGE